MIGRTEVSSVFKLQARVILWVKKTTALLIGVQLAACSSPEMTDNDEHRRRQQQEVAAIKRSINDYHARLASNRADVCPKLVEQTVDRAVINRSAEVMTDDYCDYFLYPNTNQSIDVMVNNDQIEAVLIVPSIHDFANGPYTVTSYDKHVIRLSYEGPASEAKNITYDVDILITD